MILNPGCKESFPVFLYQLSYFSQIPILESVILPKLYWIQENHHMPLIPSNMNMRRLMIIWINCDIVAVLLPAKEFNQADNLATT